MYKIIAGCLIMASTISTYASSPFQYISFIFQGIQFVASEYIPEEIVVTAEGVGINRNVAIENALNVAVQKAVGVLILTDQTASNDKVVRNLVAQYSSGVVNSYEVKKCEGKPVSCEIVAKVSPWKFMRKLEGDSQTIQVNGDDLLMKHQTAKNVLIQRYKMTQYYMSQIRQSGLDAKIRSVSIDPNVNQMVTLVIDYEVKWNKEFKKEIIKFLEKLEKDTESNQPNHQVYIQWGPTGFFENRVRVNTYSENFKRMILHYIYEPIFVKIDELNICVNINHDDVFTVDWYGVRRQITLQVEPNKLRNLNQLSIGISC